MRGPRQRRRPVPAWRMPGSAHLWSPPPGSDWRSTASLLTYGRRHLDPVGGARPAGICSEKSAMGLAATNTRSGISTGREVPVAPVLEPVLPFRD